MANTENTKINIWLPLLMSCILIIGMMIGKKLQQNQPNIFLNSENYTKDELKKYHGVEEILHYIDAKYMDNVSPTALSEDAINTILHHLDPHSEYISAANLQESEDDLAGNFEGIGVNFSFLNDSLTVVYVFPNSPAQAAGVLSGDQLIAIGDSSLVCKTDMEKEAAIKKLKGKNTQPFKIKLFRSTTQQQLSLEMKSEKISSQSIEVAMMLNENTGFIKLNRFCSVSFNEFMKNLEVLVTTNKAENLVIDLRDNPGGYLQEAINILSQLFKEKDKLLLYTVGKNGQKNEYFSSGKNFFNLNKIVVLIDEGSASSSEIMAGALQDWDRATIIGRRSFGKGLVQDQYEMSDGSAVRLTVARYYTPSGRSIQRPYKGKYSENYENELSERLKSGEVSGKIILQSTESQEFKTASGRKVYSNNGISPDIFVAEDTLFLGEKYACVSQNIPNFVLLTRRNNRIVFDNLNTFCEKFVVSKEIENSFFNYSTTAHCDFNLKEKEKMSDKIKTQIKAEIAKQIFGNIGYYTVTNQSDLCIKKSIQVLNN